MAFMRVLLCVVVAQRLFQPALPLRFTALHSPASPDERGAGVRGAGTAASRAAVRFPPQSEAAELPLGWKPAPVALLAVLGVLLGAAGALGFHRPPRAGRARMTATSREPLFVINGFYMAMREKFTAADARIHYFVVDWPADKVGWGDFRSKVLGATDPATAADGSIRQAIFEQYEELGLPGAPNVGDNGVHASASPFEAMCERVNWLGVPLENDPFAQALLNLGIPKEKLAAWTKDPQVPLGDPSVFPLGETGSLFDALEDMDSSACLEKAADIAGVTGFTAPLLMNSAFVFVKPHAVTEKAIALVKTALEKQGFTIQKEGELDGPTIGEKKLIDNHYYAIANKASLTAPQDLNPPRAKQEEFSEKFGISWSDALAQQKVFNALDACAKMGITGDEMDAVWGKAKAAGQLVKFGGGFYAGLVDPAA